jgi:hypothetical protein
VRFVKKCRGNGENLLCDLFKNVEVMENTLCAIVQNAEVMENIFCAIVQKCRETEP